MRNIFDKDSTGDFYHDNVGDLSHLLDIPASTIRYDDQEGAVRPKRNSANKYRQYSVIDGNDLFKTREWTSVGFSMPEAKAMINTNSLPMFQDGLRSARERIDHEKFILDLKQKGIEEYEAICQSIPAKLNRITIEDRPAMWRVNHQKFDRFIIEEEKIPTLSAFTRLMPAAKMSFRFSKEDLRLCAEAGINGEQLAKTIAEFNARVENGEADPFGRVNIAAPIAADTYHIIELKMRTATTLGGLKTNDSMEVLDMNDQPIAGLYAAGEVVGAANGTESMPSCMNGWSLVSARQAAASMLSALK